MERARVGHFCRGNHESAVTVDITKLILNKEHLKHAAISVAQEGMVITRGPKHQQFGKTTRYQVLSPLLQRVYVYRLGSQAMSLRSAYIVPIERTELAQVLDEVNEIARVVLGFHVADVAQVLETKRETVSRLWYDCYYLTLLNHRLSGS